MLVVLLAIFWASLSELLEYDNNKTIKMFYIVPLLFFYNS